MGHTYPDDEYLTCLSRRRLMLGSTIVNIYYEVRSFSQHIVGISRSCYRLYFLELH